MTTPHEKAIRAFLQDKPTWQRTGLRKAVNKALLREEEMPFDYSLGFIPDAFCVDTEGKRVQLLEVEDGHPLHQIKMKRIYWFWEAMDSRSWWVTLTIYSTRTGGTVHTMHDPDFCELYYTLYPRKNNANARSPSRLA